MSQRPGHTIKHANIGIIRVPEAEGREQGEGRISEELISENFSNLMKKTLTYTFKKNIHSSQTHREHSPG